MLRSWKKRKRQEEVAKTPEKKGPSETDDSVWVDDFTAKKYKEAMKKVEDMIRVEVNPEAKLELEIWSAYCLFRIDEQEGASKLDDILSKNSSSISVNDLISNIYLWEDYIERSEEILNNAIIMFPKEPSFVSILAQCFHKKNGIDKAIEYLESSHLQDSSEVAMRLSSLYKDKKELVKARDALHKVYIKSSKSKEIMFQYADLAMDLDDYESALYLLDRLTSEFPENHTYCGYLSNCAVKLEYHDLALRSCKKAELLSESKQEWIIANIGNIYKNRGFYSEAIEYLQRSLELDKSSQYSHDRLSTALKLKKEEEDMVTETITLGRRKLLDYGKASLVTVAPDKS